MSRSATRSRPTRRSSRSRPTRSTSSCPRPASGTVTELLVEEGDTVTVGQVIARIAVGSGNGASAPATTAARRPPTTPARRGGRRRTASRRRAGPAARAPADGERSGPSTAIAAAASARTAAPSGQLVDVVTPAAGESVTEGTILEWRVKAGEFIKADATIVEISTDKVDVELPAPASGTVSELLVSEGDTVTVGQVIARIAVGAADDSTATPDGADGSAGAADRDGAPPPASCPRARRSPPSPPRAAAAEGVDLARVSGSGPAGRITKSDVLSAASGNGAAGSRRRARPTAPRAGRRAGDQADARRRGGARALHGAVALDPHGDELPHADGDGARGAPQGAQGGRAQGLLHAPDRLRDRPRRRRHAGDGRPLRRDRRQAQPRATTAR